MRECWGIDGCRAGWLAIRCNPPDFRILESADALANLIDNADSVWIDIPVGLSKAADRRCDQQLRNALGKAGSSVFLPPVRAAVYADDYEQACTINQRLTGKRISKQAWNITAKIRQVDEILSARRERIHRVFESHPEYLFMLMNQRRPLSSKKTEKGVKHRLNILEKIKPAFNELIWRIRKKHPKSQVADDDIIDAMILAAAADMGLRQIKRIGSFPETPESDERQIPMAIHYILPME